VTDHAPTSPLNCPAGKWAAIKPAQVNQEFGAFAIVMNSPRYFMMDRITIELPSGQPSSFQSLDMNYVGTLHSPWSDTLDPAPYVETRVTRSTDFPSAAGNAVYELVAPNGATYVMQSYEQIIDTTLAIGDLASLGQRLRLPTGWIYRARVTVQDLVVHAPGETRARARQPREHVSAVG
jgi:hypothetical protein